VTLRVYVRYVTPNGYCPASAGLSFAGTWRAGAEAACSKATSTLAAQWYCCRRGGQHMRSQTVTRRSIYPNRHNTSVTLEDAFWESLIEIAHHRRMSVSDLVAEIDARRQGNLASALRLFVLEFYRSQIPDRSCTKEERRDGPQCGSIRTEGECP
jgi:predicted DNA-binding ribbon-helix-helix protein